MELGHLLAEAFNLLLIGMLFVGVFLSLLVLIMPILNKIVPDDTPAPPPISSIESSQSAVADDTTLIAVISSAIQQYRNQKK